MQFGRAVAVALCVIFSHANAAKPAVTKAASPTKPVATAKKSATHAKPVATAKHAAASEAKAPAKPKMSKEAREKAAQTALPQLQSIMAQAQSSLARAERHHEKAVKKARAKVDALFQQQAKSAGELVAKYSSELAEAARELSMVINASKAELAAEEAEEAKNASVGWGGTAVEERARASAKADAALRELRHIVRKTDRDVEEASRRALEPIEDAAVKLSRKVGDLSSVSDDAKASLEGAVKQGGVGASIVAKLNITKDAKDVEKAIETARNLTAQKLKIADKELAKALANNSNATNTAVRAIEKDLANAEQEEIKRVRR